MSGEDYRSLVNITTVKGIERLTGTTSTLELTHQNVSATTGIADMVITLPTVEEARGRDYYITLGTNGGGSVLVVDATNAATRVGTMLWSAGDWMQIHSTGTRWVVAKEEVLNRLELSWIGGERGHPGINGDAVNATPSTSVPADRTMEIAAGTNSTSTLATYNAEGGITLTTDTGAADQMVIGANENTKLTGWAQYTWDTDQNTRYEVVLETGASITAVQIMAGLKLTFDPAIATDDDQAIFSYNVAGSAFWTTTVSDGGTDVSTTSAITVAVSTVYKLVVEFSGSGVSRYYVNDVLINTAVAFPTGPYALIPFVGLETSTGAKAITVRSQKISRAYGA